MQKVSWKEENDGCILDRLPQDAREILSKFRCMLVHEGIDDNIDKSIELVALEMINALNGNDSIQYKKILKDVILDIRDWEQLQDEQPELIENIPDETRIDNDKNDDEIIISPSDRIDYSNEEEEIMNSFNNGDPELFGF